MLHICKDSGRSRECIELQFQRKLQFTLPSSMQCMQIKTVAGPLGALFRQERIFPIDPVSVKAKDRYVSSKNKNERAACTSSDKLDQVIS